jgi:hypothetical protein
MAVVLDRAQRDAVYRFVVADLPEIGDITSELDRGNVAMAQRLRHRFDEDVLLLDLLDWGEGGERQSYKLAMPKEQAEAIFGRLYASIISDVEEAMSALLGHPIGATLEAAGICGDIMRRLRAESGSTTGRLEARCLYEGSRRPDCG